MASQIVDLQRRNKTRYRGVTYRERADGSRTYSVSHAGRYIPAGPTETEALAKQAELRGQKARGERPILPSRTTFSELAEQWYASKSNRLRPRTAALYREALDRLLLPRFGDWKVSSIDADAVAALIRDLEERGVSCVDPSRPKVPLGRSSIDNYLKPLQGILELAVRRRLIGTNPFLLLSRDERPKRTETAPPHNWTDEELQALLTAAEEIAAQPTSKYDYTPLLRVTAALGLRCGEVLGLQWGDFDKDDGYLHIRRQWLRSGVTGETKTKAGVRSIALPPDLKQLLLELRLSSTFSQDDDPIFASQTGGHLGHRNVTRRGWEAARDKAGLPKTLTFHDLRHAAASRMIDAGLDAVTVASVLGHENPSITLSVYAARFNRLKKDDAVRLALASAASD